VSDPTPTVLVLAKEPVPGRVKTRLCPPCTPAEAATIAAAAITDTVAAVVATTRTRPVLVLDGAVGPWLPVPIDVVAQGGGGLGDRLDAAFTHAAGPAVLVGMDTPQVPTARIDDALARLDRPEVDAVLGLTTDGGWWIIGFAVPTPGAFDGVEMSVATTGAQQRSRLDALGLRTELVGPETDIDTFADALAVADAHPHLRCAHAIHDVSRAMAASA
jgi:rSAM/selenodomain-associated transferase 1